MRANLGVLIAALAVFASGACGSSDPEAVCDGEAATCTEAGYFPLCAEPEANDAVDELEGLYCSFNDSGGLQYIGPELERAPACEGGEMVECPDGGLPVCYFLPGCLESNLP